LGVKLPFLIKAGITSIKGFKGDWPSGGGGYNVGDLGRPQNRKGIG